MPESVFGYKRRDSVTQILFNIGIPSFNTVVHNSKAVSRSSWCNVAIVRYRRYRRVTDRQTDRQTDTRRSLISASYPR